jgi:hypothetical protein
MQCRIRPRKGQERSQKKAVKGPREVSQEKGQGKAKKGPKRITSSETT